MRTRKLTISTTTIGDDQGFSLIELLVAMLSAVVVTGALFAILNISLRETSLVSDKVQANQLGRTAMTRIIDELHSACLSQGFRPIQAESSANELRFVNAYSTEAVIPNAKEAKVSGTGAFEHQIVWSSSAKTLTDYTYKSTSGEGSAVVFPAITSNHANATPTSGVMLAKNVTQSENSAKEPIPIFQYYKYNTESISSSSTAVTTLEEQKLPTTGFFITKEAENVAAVLISFREAPSDGKTERDQYVDLSNQVTLAFDAPNAETPIVDSPCE
jgi:Tfp pilus assembly protein PilW